MNWEYKTIIVEDKKKPFWSYNQPNDELLTQKLNNAGSSGWELVSIVSHGQPWNAQRLVAVFKRPISR